MGTTALVGDFIGAHKGAWRICRRHAGRGLRLSPPFLGIDRQRTNCPAAKLIGGGRIRLVSRMPISKWPAEIGFSRRGDLRWRGLFRRFTGPTSEVVIFRSEYARLFHGDKKIERPAGSLKMSRMVAENLLREANGPVGVTLSAHCASVKRVNACMRPHICWRCQAKSRQWRMIRAAQAI
jgi:hypothetical protein